MAKRVKALVKLQIPAGKATPAPPVGSALGPHGINIMAFCKEYNERTASQEGFIIPAEITVYVDHSFSFITKSPPTSDLLRRALGVEKGSGNPKNEKLGKVSKAEERTSGLLSFRISKTNFRFASVKLSLFAWIKLGRVLKAEKQTDP